jgi:hypothetical protein
LLARFAMAIHQVFRHNQRKPLVALALRDMRLRRY